MLLKSGGEALQLGFFLCSGNGFGEVVRVVGE
jgi:hypothetical protein